MRRKNKLDPLCYVHASNKIRHILSSIKCKLKTYSSIILFFCCKLVFEIKVESAKALNSAGFVPLCISLEKKSNYKFKNNMLFCILVHLLNAPFQCNTLSFHSFVYTNLYNVHFMLLSSLNVKMSLISVKDIRIDFHRKTMCSHDIYIYIYI